MPAKYEDSQTVWEEKTAIKAIDIAACDLLKELRYMGGAIFAFQYKPDNRLVLPATDGELYCYAPKRILDIFENNYSYLLRAYLHSVLHCMFMHPWLRGDRDRRLWNIACDIAVEYIIDRMDNRPFKRALSLVRKRVYDNFEAEQRTLAAAGVYRYLQGLPAEALDGLEREFITDDHVLWPKEKPDEKQLATKNKWQDIGERSERKKRRLGDESDDGDISMSKQIRAARSRRSYREFLRDFMVMREELKTDPDEFDTGLYMYGLSLYKNMPIIEPLETKEENRIRDFVVVVDTSYSTSGELIKRFLSETFKLLTEDDSFFSVGRVHVLQADDRVRTDTVIKREDDIDRIFDSFEIRGGGNTDFRPAFRYVDELMEDGAFDKLCGLLYFTDGRGIYPTRQPGYKTAFIYMEPYESEDVPPWAIQLLLDETLL
ncbi:MAG: metallopeptidase [Eubacterium sp.]|nr:metallopeptidase [Eubacterium sp.]